MKQFAISRIPFVGSMRKRPGFICIFLFLVCVTRAQDSSLIKNAPCNYYVISVKKSVLQLGDICFEDRKNLRGIEFSAGVKGIMPPFNSIVGSFYNLYSYLYGPRIGLIYKFYVDDEVYIGPYFSATYIPFRRDRFYVHEQQGTSVDIDFKRADLSLRFVVGATNKAFYRLGSRDIQNDFFSEIELSVGVRLIYADMNILRGPTSMSAPSPASPGDYADYLGKEFAFASHEGYLNGWFVTPVFNLSWSLGGRIWK